MNSTLTDCARAFHEALYPREAWLPSVWAERAPRILTDQESSEPGPWRNDRAPYLTAIMDAVADPDVEEVTVAKGAQIGFSECIRNVLGWIIDLQPGPALIVGPDQNSTEALRDERLAPLLANTPAVAAHVSPRAWDSTKRRIKFDAMSLHLAWAGSSQGLKSRPIRYLALEEPDDFPPTSGTGGDPVSKAEKRCTTYADKGLARILIGGTPTTRTGNVWRKWENAGDKRHYHVPCPHCGGYQRLVWGSPGADTPGVKWPKLTGDRAAQANAIEASNSAYYQCEFCKGQIRDFHKPDMLRRGFWASSTQTVTKAGKIEGPPAGGKRRAFHLSSLYSPWCTFSRLAAEWLLAQDNRQQLIDFLNQRLAEPFETTSATVAVTVLDQKKKAARPGLIIPPWAVRLIMTADTQGTNESDGYFYFVIRAWGMSWRSQLVDLGVVSTRQELYDLAFNRPLPIEGTEHKATCQLLLADSGGPRWQEVYSFAQSAPGFIKPTKGANRRLPWMVDKRPQREHGVILWEIDTQQTKDQLHLLIHHEDSTLWALCDRADDGYLAQMQSEQKTLDKSGQEMWQLKPGRPANHFFDCEQQQIAAAWEQRCGMPAPETPPTPPPPPQQRQLDRDDPRRLWIDQRPSNWLNR